MIIIIAMVKYYILFNTINQLNGSNNHFLLCFFLRLRVIAYFFLLQAYVCVEQLNWKGDLQKSIDIQELMSMHQKIIGNHLG